MRLHLFEWMDQPWLPAGLRNAMRSYLGAAYRATPLPRAWAGLLAPVSWEAETTRVIELGSGAGCCPC